MFESTKIMTGRLTGSQVAGIHWEFECEAIDAPHEIPAGSTVQGTGYDDGVFYVDVSRARRD